MNLTDLQKCETLTNTHESYCGKDKVLKMHTE